MDTRLPAAIAALLLLTAPVSADGGYYGALAFCAGGQVAKFIVLSESTGEEKFHVNETLKETIKFQTQKRNAVQYSPLAWYMPQKWVPVAASLIGAFLIPLGNQVVSIIQNYVGYLITDRKKNVTVIKHTTFRLLGVKVREIISLLAAAFILGAAISWTYAGPSHEFLWLLALNTVICLLAGLSHEAVHRIVGKILGISAEYTFWFTGSLMTIFTALLGNAFGLQGLLIDEVKEGTPKWKVGVMKLSAVAFSAAVMVFFAAVNLLFPHVAFQMAYSISGMWAMAEILPFKPMDGYDVRKWNIFIWFASFAVISCMFVVLTFLMAS